jgi:hypothetical protein
MAREITQAEVVAFLRALGIDTSRSFDTRLRLTPFAVEVCAQLFLHGKDGHPFLRLGQEHFASETAKFTVTISHPVP